MWPLFQILQLHFQALQNYSFDSYEFQGKVRRRNLKQHPSENPNILELLKNGSEFFQAVPLDLDTFWPLTWFVHSVCQGFKLLESYLRATLKYSVQ